MNMAQGFMRWQLVDAVDEVNAQLLELAPGYLASRVGAAPARATVRAVAPAIEAALTGADDWAAGVGPVVARAWAEPPANPAAIVAVNASASAAARSAPLSDGWLCVHVVAVNTGDAPARVTLELDDLTDAAFAPPDGAAGGARRGADATRLFDARYAVPTRVEAAAGGKKALVFEDLVGGSAAAAWELGCAPALGARAADGRNLVADAGFELSQLPTVPALAACAAGKTCYYYDMHAPFWMLPSVSDGRDARVWLSTDTTKPRSGRRCGRVTVPAIGAAGAVTLPVPGAGGTAYGPAIGWSVALANDTAYDVALYARAQPPGALELELVAGAWDKANLTQTGLTPWVGEAVSRAVTLGAEWARFEFTVPPATYSSAAVPLVGLQLRLRAVAGPGHVYLDDVSVFERVR